MIIQCELSATPLHDARIASGWIECYGTDPQLLLQREEPGFPVGWFTIELIAETGKSLDPTLYIEEGSGYSAKRSSRLWELSRSKYLAFVYLGGNVRTLRLDPMESTGTLRLRSLILKSMAPLQSVFVFAAGALNCAAHAVVKTWMSLFRVESHPLQLRPLAHVRRYGRGWISQTMDPQFLLAPSTAGLPEGWVKISLFGTGEAWPLRPKLYIDRGSGFHETTSIRLVNRCHGNLEAITNLGHPVMRLRLDPMDHSGLFQLHLFGLTGFGSLSRIFALGSSILLAGFGNPRGIRQAWIAASKASPRAGDKLYRLYKQLCIHGRQPAAQSSSVISDNVPANGPLISIVMPVYNTDREWLNRAIESVIEQTYLNWQLCIADDCSTNRIVSEVLAKFSRRDSRIMVQRRSTRGNISEASNTALEMAKGEYTAFLDHDDELTRDALAQVVHAIQQDPTIDWIYTDEDKIDSSGVTYDPFYKPDWSPEYLLSNMYTGHLTVYRTDTIRQVGSLRPEVTGSQDHDLALRISRVTNRVVHIPRILYHWRAIEGSAALGPDQKDCAAATRQALEDHVLADGIRARVEPGLLRNQLRVRFEIAGNPLISIIIPTAGRTRDVGAGPVNLLDRCVESIDKMSTWRKLEIVLVDDGRPLATASTATETPFIRVSQPTDPFNFSQKINYGVSFAKGDQLVLLNDDTEVITPDWIESMLEYSQQKCVGAVGAKLLLENGKIQHAGVVCVGGHFTHAYHGDSGDDEGYFGSAGFVRNYLAVTGACLMVKTSLFHEVNGLDCSFAANFNDVDFCLKLHRSGYRNVFTPYARLYHFESSTRSKNVAEAEWLHLQERWLSQYGRDPYYNVNLSGEYPYRID